MNRRISLGVLAVCLGGGTAAAQSYGQAPIPGDRGPEAPENVGYDQKLGNKLPLDLSLVDHDGRSAPLGEYLGGKPTVLVLHYNRCPKLCNEVITGLLDGLNELRRSDPEFVAGGPFNVVMVSVDPREPPTVARKNRELFLRQYDGRNPDAPGVWFLTAGSGQGTDVGEADRLVHRLSDAAGFRYAMRFKNREYSYHADDGKWYSADGRPLPPEPRQYDYQHAAGIAVVTPDGEVSKYLLGLVYRPRDIRLALVEASGGKIGGLTDAIAQYCFVYDQVKGHYKFTMRALAVVATPFMLLVFVMAWRTVRVIRNEQAVDAPAAAAGGDGAAGGA